MFEVDMSYGYDLCYVWALFFISQNSRQTKSCIASQFNDMKYFLYKSLPAGVFSSHMLQIFTSWRYLVTLFIIDKLYKKSESC